LDEATLQTYFDGELSGARMESATLHLASCPTCAAAAREIEEEIHLMTTALAVEFEASVPTERLRQRIDAAVLDHRVATASAPVKAGFGAFVSSLLSFGTQRMLGYASLAVVLAFGAILGLVKLNTTTPPPVGPVAADVQTPVKNQVAVVTPGSEGVRGRGQEEGNATDKNTDLGNRAQSGYQAVAYRPGKGTAKANTTLKAVATEPVKLLPGERSYLQTIARLDTTIKANKKDMRPSLQVEYERNLAVVDRAIAATRSAAKSNPNDPDAADFMFAAYQSKVDLLNTIADARVGGGRSH
jgi:anti-sigma factor RsiW